eukprot:jgi/Botrbrau1/10801/Bobra.0064s0007.1
MWRSVSALGVLSCRPQLFARTSVVLPHVPRTFQLPPPIPYSCQDGTLQVRITDLGNATCIASLRNATLSQSTSCLGNIFGNATCAEFAGSIELSAFNERGLQVGSYTLPDFDRWLANLGIGNVTSLGGDLLVDTFIVFVDPSVVVEFQLNFLPLLTNIDGSFTLFSNGTGARVTAVPGLRTVDRIAGNVTFTNSAVINLISLQNLKYVPKALSLLDNEMLGSIASLNQSAIGNITEVTIVDNEDLTGPTDFAPLGPWLGCHAKLTASRARVNIEVAGCDPGTITSPAALCSYIDGTDPCPPGPANEG